MRSSRNSSKSPSRAARFRTIGPMHDHYKTEDSGGVVYIAGYGRSGSTLLDMLLGNHARMFGAGELTWLFREANSKQSRCSCGQQVLQCEFWRDVLHRVSLRIGHDDWQRAAVVSENTERLGCLHRPTSEYVQQWTATYEAMRAVSGKPWIVDSSKSTRRGHYRLQLVGQHMPGRLKIIHLVRDPRAVMWSVARGSNRKIEGGNRKRGRAGGMTRGLLSWILTNLAVEYLLRRNSNWSTLRIRYEDFVSNTDDGLNRLGDFLELDMTEVIRQIRDGDSFPSGHGICGNRMRRSGKVVLRFDREWESKLSGTARLSSLMAWPLMKKYRYSRHQAESGSCGDGHK